MSTLIALFRLIAVEPKNKKRKEELGKLLKKSKVRAARAPKSLPKGKETAKLAQK
jgi:hypothetical protein